MEMYHKAFHLFLNFELFKQYRSCLFENFTCKKPVVFQACSILMTDLVNARYQIMTIQLSDTFFHIIPFFLLIVTNGILVFTLQTGSPSNCLRKKSQQDKEKIITAFPAAAKKQVPFCITKLSLKMSFLLKQSCKTSRRQRK